MKSSEKCIHVYTCLVKQCYAVNTFDTIANSERESGIEMMLCEKCDKAKETRIHEMWQHFTQSYYVPCMCHPSSSPSWLTTGTPSSFLSFGSRAMALSLQSPSPECFSSSGLPVEDEQGQLHVYISMYIYRYTSSSHASTYTESVRTALFRATHTYIIIIPWVEHNSHI